MHNKDRMVIALEEGGGNRQRRVIGLESLELSVLYQECLT